jgi:uncharacterized protein YbjT (DUF2867 family)
MRDSQPILIVGGTRGTGLLIAQRLVAAGQPVRVLARDPERAAMRLGSAVDLTPGDITRPDTLPAAVRGVRDIVFTAGVRSGRPSREALIRMTEYDGVLNTLTAARAVGFGGRFLYMTSMGVATPSFAGVLLNLYKGNTLVWRRRAEEAIRAAGLDYTIIRAAFLLNRPGGRHAVKVTQDDLPLAPPHRIARADVAAAFVAALHHPGASRTTFEVAWGRGSPHVDWNTLLERLRPDAEIAPRDAPDRGLPRGAARI